MAGVLWLFKLDNIKLWITPCQTRGGKVTSGVRKTGKKNTSWVYIQYFQLGPSEGCRISSIRADILPFIIHVYIPNI